MSSLSASIQSDVLSSGELLVPSAAFAGFQLTPSDVQMIRYIHEYRFLQIGHVSALLNRSYKKVHGRLLKLAQRHFLARIQLPFQKHIYVIGREGINVLVEQGIASRELIEWRLRHHELKELFLKHQLMLVDLHCMLELASRGTNITLSIWREGKELWDTVTMWRDRKRVDLPVCPDAFFVLEDKSRPEGRNRLNFFVEADRSTSTHKRFQQKLVAYWQYRKDGLHTKKYGIKTFRIVTFTLTPARAISLSAAAREVLPSEALNYFVFASADGLSLGNASPILSAMFISPREPDGSSTRLRLVPAV